MAWFPHPRVGKVAHVHGEDVFPPPRHLLTFPLHSPCTADCSPVPLLGHEVICHVEYTPIHQRHHQVLLMFVIWVSQTRIQAPHQDQL